MKKLMFALGLAVMAAGVQAASVNWSIDGNADGWGKYYTSIYAGEKATFENILKAEGMTAAKVADALKGYTDNYASTLTRGRKDGTLTDVVSEGDVLTFIVYDATTTAGASNYYITQQTVTADMLYEGTATPGKEMALTAASFSAATPFGSSGEAIPEPTSAMLLLVGAAGLALRRRR